MSRYIDTEKLCQKILDAEDYYKAKNNSNTEARIKYDFLINVVTPMVVGTPTEDVVPVVHAHWIGTEYDGFADGNPVYDTFECSNCGEEHQGEADTLTNYCPHCGAKMDEREELQ